MQRVLSFQMARGFSESSEFVTKRMCFSFLFSVGFLCLLCGFLLGRFTTERTFESRAEKKQLELAKNGLQSTEYIQHLLIREIEETSFNVTPSIESAEGNSSSLIEILSNLSLFYEVHQHKSCIMALARGSREPDRYVVLSVSESTGGIALKLAKILTKIRKEHNWEQRRSLVFCIYFGATDSCSEILSPFVQRKIVAYIAVHESEWQGPECFAISGSDIIQSIVFEATAAVLNANFYERLLATWKYNNNLQLTVPHVVFSLPEQTVTSNINRRNNTQCKVNLMKTLSQSLWRLSDCLVAKWNLSYFNRTVVSPLESLDDTNFQDTKERMRPVMMQLLINVETLNRKIDTTDSTKELEMRILNDLSMELDRTLLCSSKSVKSRTNWAATSMLPQEPHNTLTLFTEKIKCYEAALQLLQDWKKCDKYMNI